MRRYHLLLTLGLLLPACRGGSISGDSCPAMNRAEAAEASTLSPGGGCSASEPGSVCAVTSGGMSCNSVCPAAEYEMTCRSPDPSAAAPSPDRALGCKAAPLPTPSGVLFYCCPCSGQS